MDGLAATSARAQAERPTSKANLFIISAFSTTVKLATAWKARCGGPKFDYAEAFPVPR